MDCTRPISPFHSPSGTAIPSLISSRYPTTADPRATEADDVLAALNQRHAHRVDIVTSDYHTRRAGNIYRAKAPDLEIHMVAAPDVNFSPGRLVEESRRAQDFSAGMDEDRGNLVRNVIADENQSDLEIRVAVPVEVPARHGARNGRAAAERPHEGRAARWPFAAASIR